MVRSSQTPAAGAPGATGIRWRRSGRFPSWTTGGSARCVVGSSGRAWHETQGHRVHAIAQAGRPWTVVEDMAEMAVATGATDRGAAHAEQAVAAFDHVARGDRLPEAGPAGAGVELGGGVVQRRGAGHATEQARSEEHTS